MIWASTCCEMHGTGTIAHCLRMVRCRAAHMRVSFSSDVECNSLQVKRGLARVTLCWAAAESSTLTTKASWACYHASPTPFSMAS